MKVNVRYLKKYMILTIIVTMLIGSTVSVSAATAGEATSAFKRDSSSGAVQNFDIFGFNSGNKKTACMVTGASSDNIARFDLRVYEASTKTFKRVGNPINKIDGKNINSHANNVEVIKYKGDYYLLFMNGTGKTTKGIVCAKVKITVNADNDITGWTVDNQNVHYMSLFSDYNGKPILQSLLTTSSNYLCIATLYGTSLSADVERYHIYDKTKFMDKLTKSNCSQVSLNACRYGTGMFKSGTIGFNINKSNAVIQSIEMGEKDSNTVIIFANIDNRDGRDKHQINRVYLNLKKSDPLPAQDMTKNTRYYSKVLRVHNGTKSISMNCKGATVDGKTVQKNFELEGIRRVTGLSEYGIPTGWYINVHNGSCSNYNMRIYKAPTGDVIAYKN